LRFKNESSEAVRLIFLLQSVGCSDHSHLLINPVFGAIRAKGPVLRLVTLRMLSFRFAAFLGLAVLPTLPVAATENNFWPVWVGQRAAAEDPVESWQGAGPLFFSQPQDDVTWSGFRPLFVQKRAADGHVAEADVLYPVFIYRTYGQDYRWSLLDLINRDTRAGRGRGDNETFDVWPFYFSRNTGDPATSYHAVFPLYGTVYNRFSNQKLTWVLFPLYSRSENRGVVVTMSPWPFVRTVGGGGQSGFALWPLFGWRDQPGVFRQRYCLWPFYYNNEAEVEDSGHQEQFAVLPFYARESRPGAHSETYLWPFFGYADTTTPKRYHETHYFWPFFVQGRGEEVYRNRWGPFYTHSVVKGFDKTWYAWPLVCRTRWTEDGLVQSQTKFFYLIYNSFEQRSATRPELAPARKTHLWPLFSDWDNGAGRRQFQLVSPFEVFFPDNDAVRAAWNPLVALYRYDRRAPGDVHWSVLFDLVTYRRRDGGSEFHLGPLFGVESRPERHRFMLAGGLFGHERTAAGSRWRLFWLDFPTNPAKTEAPATRP
jgi:hypothetical protein